MASVTQNSVLLVDDHEIMRDGLREVLHRAGDFQVVGEAADGEAAVKIAQELKPDVIVMDVMMPVKNGIDACREITEALPDTRVLDPHGCNRRGCRGGGGSRGRDGIPSKILGQGAVAARRPRRCGWRV